MDSFGPLQFNPMPAPQLGDRPSPLQSAITNLAPALQQKLQQRTANRGTARPHRQFPNAHQANVLDNVLAPSHEVT